MSANGDRPSWEPYFMDIAVLVAPAEKYEHTTLVRFVRYRTRLEHCYDRDHG